MDRLLLIAAGLYLLLKSGFSKIRYFPVGIQLMSITPLQIRGVINIRIDNNNPYPLSARSFSGHLIYMSENVGTVNIREGVTIPANGSAVIQLSAEIKTTTALQAALNYGQGQSIRLVGRLHFEKLSIPVITSFAL